jgi:L-ascorbate metabolism protein UlaG (beta-lactamase superfamily)
MKRDSVKLTLIGGPTLLLEVGGLRLVTDPTFDPPQSYESAGIRLTKLTGPSMPPQALGSIDAVLLSHDQHLDNLDRSGRAMLPLARRVLTTVAGAARLGGNAEGLAPWSSKAVPLADGRTLRVTGTPARHPEPAGCSHGIRCRGASFETADARTQRSDEHRPLKNASRSRGIRLSLRSRRSGPG